MSGPFKLRSGNATPFKQMGSSPMKQDDVESYNKEQKAKYDADLKKYQEDLKSHQDSTASYSRALIAATPRKGDESLDMQYDAIKENVESGIYPDYSATINTLFPHQKGFTVEDRIIAHTKAAEQVKPGPAPVKPKEPVYMITSKSAKKLKVEEKEQEPTKTKKKYIKTKKKGEYINLETGEKVKIGGKSKKSKKKKRVKKRRTKNLVTGGINITE
jgi:hypothetical protein